MQVYAPTVRHVVAAAVVCVMADDDSRADVP